MKNWQVAQCSSSTDAHCSAFFASFLSLGDTKSGPQLPATPIIVLPLPYESRRRQRRHIRPAALMIPSPTAAAAAPAQCGRRRLVSLAAGGKFPAEEQIPRETDGSDWLTGAWDDVES